MKHLFFKQKYLYIYILIVIIIFAGLNYISLKNIKSNYAFSQFYSNVNYDYTVQVENQKPSSYYIEDFSFCKTKNSDGSFSKYIKAKTLMLCNVKYESMGYYSSNNIYKGQFKILQTNEISITKNISESMNIKIGDAVYLSDDKQNNSYKVVNILNNTYDFSKPEVNEYQSYIFIGNNEKLASSKYISFSTYNNSVDNVDMNAKNYFIVSQAVNNANKNIAIQIILLVATITVFVIIYFIFLNRDTANCILLYNNGYKKSKILLYTFLQSVFIFISSTLPLVLISSILKSDKVIILIEMFILAILIYVVNFIRLERAIK